MVKTNFNNAYIRVIYSCSCIIKYKIKDKITSYYCPHCKRTGYFHITRIIMPNKTIEKEKEIKDFLLTFKS